MKVTRSAFLYMDPKPPIRRFAQCGTCRYFAPGRQRCAVIGIRVDPEDSCGLYVHGRPLDQAIVQSVTAAEAGWTDEPVRCENCTYFKADVSGCHLYYQLNEALPSIFDLNKNVDPHGCCNAQTPKPQVSALIRKVRKRR